MFANIEPRRISFALALSRALDRAQREIATLEEIRDTR